MNYCRSSHAAGSADDPAGDRARRVRDARLQELLSRYGDLLRRTIAKVCPQTMGLSVEEIEQDARVRLWSALKSEREIVHPVSYIYKVAVSAALRAIRRAKARREDQLQEEDVGANDGPPAEVLRTPPDASPEAWRSGANGCARSTSRWRTSRRTGGGPHGSICGA